MVDVAEIQAICREQFDAAPPEPGALSARVAAIQAVEERLGVRFTNVEMDTAETPETIADLARREIRGQAVGPLLRRKSCAGSISGISCISTMPDHVERRPSICATCGAVRTAAFSVSTWRPEPASLRLVDRSLAAAILRRVVAHRHRDRPASGEGAVLRRSLGDVLGRLCRIACRDGRVDEWLPVRSVSTVVMSMARAVVEGAVGGCCAIAALGISSRKARTRLHVSVFP